MARQQILPRGGVLALAMARAEILSMGLSMGWAMGVAGAGAPTWARVVPIGLAKPRAVAGIQGASLAGTVVVVVVVAAAVAVVAVDVVVDLVVDLDLAAALAVAVIRAVTETGVGARLRQERLVAALQGQAAPSEKIRQHRILAEAELPLAQLQGHMPIAQVISRLQQGEGCRGARHEQGLRSRLHVHQRTTPLRRQPFAGPQRLTAGKLQQQRPSTTAQPPTAQPGALLGGERQPQRPSAARGFRPAFVPQPAGQQQRRWWIGDFFSHRYLPGAIRPHSVAMLCPCRRDAQPLGPLAR